MLAIKVYRGLAFRVDKRVPPSLNLYTRARDDHPVQRFADRDGPGG
jgi:hypothetical protein